MSTRWLLNLLSRNGTSGSELEMIALMIQINELMNQKIKEAIKKTTSGAQIPIRNCTCGMWKFLHLWKLSPMLITYWLVKYEMRRILCQCALLKYTLWIVECWVKRCVDLYALGQDNYYFQLDYFLKVSSAWLGMACLHIVSFSNTPIALKSLPPPGPTVGLGTYSFYPPWSSLVISPRVFIFWETGLFEHELSILLAWSL